MESLWRKKSKSSTSLSRASQARRPLKSIYCMVITIQGTGIDLTESIKEYAEEKIGGVEKFFDNIQTVDVDLGELNHPNAGKTFYAEVNVSIPGKLIRVRKDSETLYKAIDKVKDHLKVEFEKMKGKMRDKDREVIREQKAYADEE